MTDLGSGRFLSFDPVAAEYDRTRIMPPSILDQVARVCDQEADLDRGGLFLDAAVGTGRFAAPLARLRSGQILGVDIAPAMLAEAQRKAALSELPLVRGDVQRLPFRSGVFAGALVVHLLHLIEQWRQVLSELRRVLAPRTGVLLLGGEQGGRSALVDFYYARARGLGVLAQSLGTPGFTQTLSYLQRDPQARIQRLGLPYLRWQRAAPLPETLEALQRRTYSQMWSIPDDAHRALMEETHRHALRLQADGVSQENLRSSFVLYTIRWL